MAKILLVEDDDNLREIYEARLMAEGYDIVTAPDGEAALVVAKDNKPDLIISDVMMPNISGFDMLDILRNTQGLHDAKVIMLTALSQEDDKLRAEKLGADRYLVKSQVTLEDIVNTAAELLGGALPEPAAVEPAPEQTAQPELTLNVPVDPTVVTPLPEPVAPVVPQPMPEPVLAAPVAVQPIAQVEAVQPMQVPAAPVEPVAIAAQPEPIMQQPVAQVPDPTAMPVPPQQAPTTDVQTIVDPVVPAPNYAEPVQPELTPEAVPMQPQAFTEPQPLAPPAPAVELSATSDIPVAQAPEITEDLPSVISMPSTQAPQPVAAEPVQHVVPPTPLPEPAAAQNPQPVIQPPATVQPTITYTTPPATQELTPESPTEATTTPEQLDPSEVQTASSESAAVQQQIDQFVNTAPIATPEFDPEAFDATNEQGVAETIPVAAPQPEALPVPVTPVAAPETPQAAAPEALAAPQVAAPETSALPPVQQTTHAATGGNKIIQPLSNDPAKSGPTLDELLAMEEAQSPVAPAPIIGGQSGPVVAQPVQSTPVQPAPPAPASQQASVFDPDDPSSVAL